MFVDLRNDTVAPTLECDICIVGAGAAGITLARALIGSSLDVCLLESGGFVAEAGTQSLYDGELTGLQNASPLACRVRHFGGTTHHWTGWCRPLDGIDFEPRPWVAHSGWPIGRSELQPYYERAQAVVQIGAPGFGPEVYAQHARALPEFDERRIGVDYFRFSPPTRFGQVYRRELEEARNVRVYLHANALPLVTDSTGSQVREVPVRTLEGRSVRFRPRAVVLACGGMENARMLLLSNEGRPAGLGNAQDLVGRFFMQHVEAVVARVWAGDAGSLADRFQKFELGEASARAELVLGADAQRRHGLLNAGFTLMTSTQAGAGYRALRALWRDLRRGRWPENAGEDLRTVLGDLGSVADAITDGEAPLDLYVRAEPAPLADSRITLGAERDPFGLPRIRVHWQLAEGDKRSIAGAVTRVAEEFGRLDLGRIEMLDWLAQADAPWPQPLWGGCHHMGTTRMADDPANGVVDRDCRVHGVDNLYIAGSSVFPTAGYVPPTLTIVAMALRLAAHLGDRHV